MAMTDNDKDDVITDLKSQLIENACLMVALSKEKQTNATAVVYVDEDGNDATVTVYDFKYHTWKSTDTFDALAADLLGSADYGTVIAYFNGVANESELEAGTKIKIPVLTESETNTNNKIYAAPEKQDNYGVDIAIDEDGDFDLSGGDIKTVNDRDNLTQAISLRLTTASQKRIRLTSYGIRSTIGDPMAVESYLTGSLEQTVKADPRIDEVEEISFKGDGDNLKLEVVYTDINGNTGTYEGDI